MAVPQRPSMLRTVLMVHWTIRLRQQRHWMSSQSSVTAQCLHCCANGISCLHACARVTHADAASPTPAAAVTPSADLLRSGFHPAAGSGRLPCSRSIPAPTLRQVRSQTDVFLHTWPEGQLMWRAISSPDLGTKRVCQSQGHRQAAFQPMHQARAPKSFGKQVLQCSTALLLSRWGGRFRLCCFCGDGEAVWAWRC